MQDRSAQQLQQHAQRAFQASETLLRQASQGGGSSDRFYTAANRYATTLRTLGGSMSGQGGAAASGLGGSAQAAHSSAGGASGSGRRIGCGRRSSASLGGGSMMGVDQASVAVINHAVKESLDSMQLRQMVRTMGSSEGTEARAVARPYP